MNLQQISTNVLVGVERKSLKGLEQKGDIAMVEAIYSWGLMWQRLGWNFLPSTSR